MSTAQTDSFSCRFAGCAAPPTPAGPCVGHCDSEQLREAVAHWFEHDQPIDLHNANVTADDVALLADVLPREKGGTTVLPAIDCSGAAFAGARIDFSRFRFTGEATFVEATFDGDALFRNAIFARKPSFRRATFLHQASFLETEFQDGADFAQAEFDGVASFLGAKSRSDLSFVSARFARRARIGPIAVGGDVFLDSGVCEERVTIRIDAQRALLTGAILQTSSRIEMSHGDVVLDECSFSHASTIVGKAGARLVSLRRADVADVTIDGIDLRACRFLGAHNLDRLRLDGTVQLPSAPEGVRWARRKTIAEEHHYRETSSGWYPAECRSPDWLGDTDNVEEAARPTPSQVESVYRALRKSMEDHGNAPGAGDFYYGEMEMRRHRLREHSGLSRAALERLLVWLYWLTSGYGLRATRAVASLLVVVTASTAALALGGFEAPAVEWRIVGTTSSQSPQYAPYRPGRDKTADALLGSLSATIPGFDHALPPRTPIGDATLLLDHLLGPALLGLAIFSLRGQLKR